MSEGFFPRRRDDGSSAVAARFTAVAPDARRQLVEAVAGWVAAKEELGVDFAQDLLRPLRVEVDAVGYLVVIADGRPGRRLWKDWLVYLVRHLQDSLPAVRFSGFYDLVADRPHPAWRATSGGD